MFIQDIQKHIALLFELNAFRAGLHGSLNVADDKYGTYLNVDFLWAAEVYYYERPLVVAVMHQGTNHKAVLIDVAEKVSKNSIVIRLDQWSDPVEEALQCLNLAPKNMSALIYSLNLFVATMSMETKIFMGLENSRDSSRGRLSLAVLEVIEKISTLYGSRDWHYLLQTRMDDE